MFLDVLGAVRERFNWTVHAYCLMTNHVHLILEPRTDGGAISRLMRRVSARQGRRVNRLERRIGTLWSGRFKSSVIDTDRYLMACLRYVELNPVRNQLVDKPQDYRWSSYAHNALAQTDEMMSAAGEYQKLGSTERECAREYKKLFRQKISAEQAQEITDATLKGWVLGDSKFAKKIEKLSGRRATQLPKGRPKKS